MPWPARHRVQLGFVLGATDGSIARVATPPDADRRRVRRLAARRRAVSRRRRVAVLAVVALTALVALWRSGGPATVHRTPAASRHAVATQASPSHSVSARPGPSPGSLPQTRAYPSQTGALFKSLMAALWRGVDTGSLAAALPAFFPQAAYVQLKAISSASSDWTNRLVHDYGLDIASAHALLGRDAPKARLIGVAVTESYGHWIVPGICYNRIGYYEVPNARVVYREDGQVRSFGIASMISWRGEWYVVHFGAILRSTDSGTVDDPTVGPGTSLYSGTC
jgi:hypothetical protein